MTESMEGGVEEEGGIEEEDGVEVEGGVDEEDEVDEANWGDGRVIGKSCSNSSLPSRVKTYTTAVSNFFGDVGMAEVNRIILK